MTRSCTVYSGKLMLTVQVFLGKVALGMDENAPNLELKHSGPCRRVCRGRIFDIGFVQKVLLHTPYTSSSLLRKATTARCNRSRGPLFPCFFFAIASYQNYICSDGSKGPVLLLFLWFFVATTFNQNYLVLAGRAKPLEKVFHWCHCICSEIR